MIYFINDPHIADRPPLGRVEGYADQILAKLEECRELARADSASLTVFTGDVFHIKRPSFVSHALMQRMIDLLREWPGRKFTVLGNHDLSEAGLASVPKQPIGVLLRAGVLELLPEDGIVVEVSGCKVYLEAAHYSDTDDPEYFALHNRPKCDVAIKVTHGMLVPPGRDPPFDHIKAEDIPAGADYLFNGHIHDDYGAREINGCTHVNFGSLGRVARTDENRKREVAIAVYDPVKNVVTRRALKSALPSADIFITVEAENVEDSDDLKAYARELAHALQQGTGASIEDLLAGASDGVAKDVKVEVTRYLTEAGL
ncbi:hypothetical protein LCGC14_2709560 [marine sediment metagenome]|uniref:Calcineurin-like phosphoesterase domain-containing protein n=1 Tax=marine sediment metagenome TaxID=412755 RepID=A0A0F9C516_9ZZZZ